MSRAFVRALGVIGLAACAAIIGAPTARASGASSTAMHPAPQTSARARAMAVGMQPPTERVWPGVLIVHRRVDQRPGLPIAGFHLERATDAGAEIWRADAPIDAAATLALRAHLLASRDDLAHVDVDLVRSAQLVPNDEYYSYQWSLQQMHAEQAWDLDTGDVNLVVAVVDSGIVDHDDLRARLVPGYDFISDPSLAGDGDGRDGDPTDEGDQTEASSGFHGTHVSGIIGASSNNGVGISGVDWHCGIMPVRVLGVSARGSSDIDIADAIRWSAGLPVAGAPKNGNVARVINLSFGGPGYSQLLQDAIIAAHDAGALVIASAGNASGDAMDNVPGALEDVLSVGATDPSGAIAPYSNAGARLDLLSPGGSYDYETPVGLADPNGKRLILSTSYLRSPPQQVYAYAAGTSQAAANASGVAALMRSSAPGLDPDVIAAIMRRTAQAAHGDCSRGCGAGVIDARAALESARAIEAAECGGTKCGTNLVEAQPLHREEGCAVARPGRGNAQPSAIAAVLFGLSTLAACVRDRRRRRRRRRRSRVVGGWGWIGIGVLSFGASACAPAAPTNASADGGNGSLSISITDPVPKLVGGDLAISIGGGRSISVSVTPAAHIDYVELVAAGADVDTLLARQAHAPFVFTLSPSVLSLAPPGISPLEIYVCVRAWDDSGAADPSILCFYATP